MRTVMTLEEVAAYLRVHQSTVYRLLKAQSIPAFKLGSDWRFNQESIDKWIAESEQRSRRFASTTKATGSARRKLHGAEQADMITAEGSRSGRRA
jgi:excisionase family DNA binding protein